MNIFIKQGQMRILGKEDNAKMTGMCHYEEEPTSLR